MLKERLKSTPTVAVHGCTCNCWSISFGRSRATFVGVLNQRYLSKYVHACIIILYIDLFSGRPNPGRSRRVGNHCHVRVCVTGT